MAVLEKNTIHIIITDQRMPQMTGVEFLEKILTIHPNPIRVLLTGYSDMGAIINAINKGKIYHYLTKPWSEEELTQTIEKGYEIYLEKQKMNLLNSKLSLSNEQLEFLLRQKLLS